MTDQTAHEEWEELAAGYALHALDPVEERRFVSHLESCPQCVAALDDYTLVAAQLGSVADAGSAASEADEPPAWSQIRGGIVADSASASVVSLDQVRRSRAAQLIAAAAAVVVVVGVVSWQTAGSSGRGSSPGIAALSACEERVSCHAIRLRAPNGGNPATVIVDGGSAAVVPLSLRAAPSGKTYVLWQMPSDGSPIPVSEFRTTDGKQTASTPLPTSYASTAAFAISVERANVAPKRPTKILAVGTAT